MALVQESGVAQRDRELTERERWPDEKRIDKRMEHLVFAHGLIAFVWIACGLLILHRVEHEVAS